MNKAVYIGAGLDIIPLLVLSHIKEFIYIDSLPNTEYGTHKLPIPTCDLYRPYFLPQLRQILQNNSFVCITEKPNYIEYANNDKTLKYYINTAFPTNLNDELKTHLSESEHLIICGYDPDTIVFDYMPKLINIICNAHTVYNLPDEYECGKQTAIRYLANHQTKYKFQLMKEKTAFPYWERMLINSEIKNNYTVCNVTGFDEIKTIKLRMREEQPDVLCD